MSQVNCDMEGTVNANKPIEIGVGLAKTKQIVIYFCTRISYEFRR